MARRTELKRPPGAIDLETMVYGVAGAIGDAQAAMDQASLATAARLEELGLTERFGMQAHWYALTETLFDLKLLMQISEESELLVQMVDGELSSRYQVDVEATSTFHMTVRRTPQEVNEPASLRTTDEITRLISGIKRVAAIFHENPGCRLAIDFAPTSPAPLYDGGTWTAEVVRPPDFRTSTRTATRNSIQGLNARSGQEEGLVLEAFFQIDDRSGEIGVARYF